MSAADSDGPDLVGLLGASKTVSKITGSLTLLR